MVAESIQTQTRPSNPDPISDFSILSLHCRTFNNKSKHSNEDSEQSIDAYLQSMALRSPYTLLEQAMSILKSSSDNKDLDVPVEDMHRAVTEMDKNRLQERRPGLGHKRARFSMKPDTSQPSLEVNTILNLDKIQDPKELFSALERHRNATKELRKQRKEDSVGSQHNPVTKERVRRPGILGKKAAGHKHRYSICPWDSDDSLLSSQDEIGTAPPFQSVSNLTSLWEDQLGTSQEKELAGADDRNAIQDSVAVADDDANNMYNELMSKTDLDEDEALNYLQERLHKPVHLEELNLPDMDRIMKRHDNKEIVKQPIKSRKTLEDIHNMIIKVHSEVTSGKQQSAESLSFPQTSPTLPNGPFASIAAPKKHNSLSNLLFKFPFDDIGVSLSKTSPHSNVNVNQAPSHSIVRIHLDVDDSTTISQHNIESRNLMNGNIARPSESMDINLNCYNADIHSSSAPDVDLEDKVENKQQAAVVSEEPEQVIEHLTLESTHGSGSQTGNNNATTVGHLPMDRLIDKAIPFPELHHEDQHPSSLIDQSKPKSPKQGKRKRDTKKNNAGTYTVLNDEASKRLRSLSPQSMPKAPTQANGRREVSKKAPAQAKRRREVPHRQSLAEAGTVVEDGVRKSRREKSRPLEYWKGERFIFGRVHQSLSTVIGVKYQSPGKGFQVKSYSDEHKDLVEKLAFH